MSSGVNGTMEESLAYIWATAPSLRTIMRYLAAAAAGSTFAMTWPSNASTPSGATHRYKRTCLKRDVVALFADALFQPPDEGRHEVARPHQAITAPVEQWTKARPHRRRRHG